MKINEENFKIMERLKTLTQQNNVSKDEKKKVLKFEWQRVEKNQKRRAKIDEEREKIRQIEWSYGQKWLEISQQITVVENNLLAQLQNDGQQQGLSRRKIRRFHLFTADETLDGQQCAICLEDISIGRRMRRLTCDGQHAFCPGCCETWFANNNTCPLCRHVFV